MIKLEVDISQDAGVQANQIAKIIIDWFNEQGIAWEVVEGGLGVLLVNILQSSNRKGFEIVFDDGDKISIKLDKPEEAQDDNPSA